MIVDPSAAALSSRRQNLIDQPIVRCFERLDKSNSRQFKAILESSLSRWRTPARCLRGDRAPCVFCEGSRKGGVDEDVGIKADHHRSCILSRVKVRGAAPQGSPCAITSIA
jgi:hypothetical protein